MCVGSQMIRGWDDFYWGLGTCKKELPWVKQVGKRKGGYIPIHT